MSDTIQMVEMNICKELHCTFVMQTYFQGLHWYEEQSHAISFTLHTDRHLNDLESYSRRTTPGDIISMFSDIQVGVLQAVLSGIRLLAFVLAFFSIIL